MTPNIIAHDRYSAAGIERPNPETVCTGRCEGMGFLPITLAFAETYGAEYVKRFNEAQHDDEMPAWRFITCPVCEGTGKRA